MSAIRTWWWAGVEDGAERSFERVRSLLAAAPLSRVLAATPDGSGAAERIAGALARPVELREDVVAGLLAPPSGRASLLDEPAGTQVLIVAPRETIRDALLLALGLAGGDDAGVPVDVRPGALAAIDWPPRGDPGGRPSLIGLDLDWTPPPPAAQRARFPGGPGSAPSIRG